MATKAAVRSVIIIAMSIGFATILAVAGLCFIASSVFNTYWIWLLIIIPIGYWLYLLPQAIKDWR